MSKELILKKRNVAVKKLIGSDAQMAGLVKLIGEFSINLRSDYFTALCRAIVGQQLSMKAAETIWHRTVELCGHMAPEVVLKLTDDELRGAGLSRAKVVYIKDLSSRVLSGELNLDGIEGMFDDEVIAALTDVKGIGRWTAEMFLIFTLGRPDVWPVDDLGVRRAVQWVYGLAELPNKAEMTAYGLRWQPHRTAAALYLWEAINRKYC